MKLNGTLVFSVLMVIVSGALLMSAGSITTSPFDPVGARIFPLSVALLLCVLCLVQLGLRILETLRSAAKAAPEQVPAEAMAGPAILVRVILVLVLLAGCVLLMQMKLIGALTAMVVAVLGSALLLAPVRGWAALSREAGWAVLLAVILAGTSYLLFVQTFGIRL